MTSLGYQLSTGQGVQVITSRTRHRWLCAALLGILAAMAPATAVGQSDASSDAPALRYVVFGDSWPEGDHCGGCQTFSDLWADGMRDATGREILMADLTGQQEPGLPPGTGETTATLLESLRFNTTARDAARGADIILISNGANDLEPLWAPPPGVDCTGSLQIDCVNAVGRLWRVNFEAILEEIELLRDGAPTAVRLVNAANLALFDAEFAALLAEDLAPTKGALIWDLLYDAQCGAAAGHGAVCVDVRPIIHGPLLDQPGDENAPESMRGVADALLATGLPELE